jgi:ribonuclease P protein component
MFVVPKRNFKKAHDRNRLRRQVKEAYRLEKSNVYERLSPEGKKYTCALLYTSRKSEGYNAISGAVKKLLGGL